MAKRKPWSGRPKGEHGYTVVACEREPGSKLYLRFRDPETAKRTKRSLGHHDRKRAQRQAGDLAETLELRETPFQATLGVVFKLYQRHKTPQKKPPGQVADRRRVAMFELFFGPDVCRKIFSFYFADLLKRHSFKLSRGRSKYDNFTLVYNCKISFSGKCFVKKTTPLFSVC